MFNDTVKRKRSVTKRGGEVTVLEAVTLQVKAVGYV